MKYKVTKRSAPMLVGLINKFFNSFKENDSPIYDKEYYRNSLSMTRSKSNYTYVTWSGYCILSDEGIYVERPIKDTIKYGDYIELDGNSFKCWRQGGHPEVLRTRSGEYIGVHQDRSKGRIYYRGRSCSEESESY